MAKKDDTYELIRAMSANEKRFFRLSSIQAGKETNYLRVFTAMDSLPEFDPVKLKRKLSGKKINLSYEKNYLYQQMLRSLRHFYSSGNSVIELQDILKSLEILYRKRLNAQCQKLVNRGITICREFEQWHYHLELIEWQYRLYARMGNYKALGEYASEGFREKKELMQQISLYSQQRETQYFIFSVLQQKGAFMNEAERERFEQLRRSYSAKREKKAGNFRVVEMEHTMQYMLHHYLGDFKQAYLWSKANRELYHSHPQYVQEQPFRYFAATNSLVNRCLGLDKYEEALQLIHELEAFVAKLAPIDLQEIQQEHFYIVLTWKARIFFKLERHEEALEVAHVFERKVNMKHLRPLLRLTADSFLARIYFYNGQYKASLSKVNRQLRDGRSVLQPDYLIFAWLLRICIYWELQNYDLLEPQIRALKHFMKTNNVTDVFATLFTDRLRNHEPKSNAKAQKQFWAEMCKTLGPLITKETEQYEVIVYWMEGKVG